jgi:predicted nucleic acid-binding protein
VAVLDTTALIDLSRSTRRSVACKERIVDLVKSGEEIVTTRVNLAELYAGVALAERTDAEHTIVEKLKSWIPVLELDDRGVRVFGQAFAALRRAGKRVPDADLLIASIAIAHGHSVLTANPKHYTPIDGCLVLDYRC